MQRVAFSEDEGRAQYDDNYFKTPLFILVFDFVDFLWMSIRPVSHDR